jgi:prolyl oligopeptidase
MRIELSLVVRVLFEENLMQYSLEKSQSKENRVQPPPTRVEAIEEEIFGVKVKDPYRWLEDVKSPEVQEWMTAQNNFTRSFLDQYPGREKLKERFKEIYYVDSVSAPWRRGERYFYSRTHATKEKAIVYYKDGENGEEKVLFDPNTMSEDGSVSLGVWSPTYDGKHVAYALRRNNADEATLYLRDIDANKDSEIDVIEGAKYASPSWLPNGEGFYYTYLPTDNTIPVEERPGYAEVRFHKIGTDPKQDTLVFPKTGDPTKFVGAGVSRDGRWLFATVSYGWTANDVFIQDRSEPNPQWRPFIVGQKALYSVSVWEGYFYIQTNEDAPKYKVLRTKIEQPEKEHWKEIIPQEEAVLESANIVGGKMCLVYLHNASNQIRITDLEGKFIREVPLPTIGSTGGLFGEPDEDDAYFGFSSFTYPSEIYKTKVSTGETSLWASIKLPIDHTPYKVEQVWYESKDKTRVSMFIICRKDIVLDGKTPFILYGYGGFSINMLPSFSSGMYPWLESGGGYAIPNLRGGAEYGEEWHINGMRDKKQNVFDDFIAAAEFLIAKRYTSTPKIAISGGSNGGLLVGACMAQRPDLFGAVICGVPLLDMIRYTKYGSGKTWIEEYGDPDKEEEFRWLYAYSPYHHIQSNVPYPAFLLAGADSDDRVDPFHGRKFTALVQAATTSSDKPVLLRIEKNAGHGGADLVKQAVESSVDRLSFLLQVLA